MQVKDYSSSKNTAMAAEAAFKSKTKRQGILVGNTRIPSPSNVMQNLLRDIFFLAIAMAISEKIIIL